MYIIIRGPLGIGKSTIAKELAKKLKAKYISIDEVLKKHDLDVIDKKEGCILAKNFIKGNNIILAKIKEKLKEKVVILDGCFYHKEQIEHLKKNLKPIFIFTLKAPLKVCIERDTNRKKSYGKDAAKAVFDLVSRFDYGYIIDTENKDIDETVKEIVSYLN